MPRLSFVAVLDACVLYPFQLRNLLIQCAFDRLLDARWSDRIHDEWIRNLSANTPGLSIDRLRSTRDKMKAVLPEADVVGYESLIDQLTLKDPDDRHVLAVAIKANARLIVTWNMRDFPTRVLQPFGIEAKSPDVFLMEVYSAYPRHFMASLTQARLNLRKTKPSPEEFAASLERQGLANVSKLARQHC